jgi:class 3 adenylate cyclase
MDRINVIEHLQEVIEDLHGAHMDHHLQRHAPRKHFDPTRTDVSPRVRRAIAERQPIEAIVMTADIRKSSSVMRESIDPLQFANILDDFVGEFRTVLGYHDGWFDKFTGDGFICYWLIEDSYAAQMETVLAFSATVMESFRSYYCPAFIANLRNIPSGVGLSIGIDAGPCHVAPVAGDLTLLGQPIVGAVRMADAARRPYELLMNAYPGNRLTEGGTRNTGHLATDLNYQATKCIVETKEYPEGQEAYAVTFLKGGQNIFA